MSVNYTYEIIKVDPQARCMEVVYSATGHETQNIGARLPYEGETVEQVIRMYAPLAYWEEKQRNVLIPQVGYAGVVNAADEADEALQAAMDQAVVVGAETL